MKHSGPRNLSCILASFAVALGTQACSQAPAQSVQQAAQTPASPSPASSKEGAKSAPNNQAKFDGLTGGSIDLAVYRGKVVLVVNTASQCGFTGQYEGLEKLYQARSKDGLVIVGVPSNDFGGQEPGSAQEIKKFCDLNYGVTFPMAAKYAVTGESAHPFYRQARSILGQKAEPAWNFHKILVGKDGLPVNAFGSSVTPDAPELTSAIDSALKT
jgi:glutathione peroxidase